MRNGWITLPLPRAENHGAADGKCGLPLATMRKWRSFRHFIAACEGESLYWQAAFDALHAYQVKEDGTSAGLTTAGGVPVGRAPAVKHREAHREEVEFYLWLQWLARRQFAACWDTKQSFLNYRIGLVPRFSGWRRKAARKTRAIGSCVLPEHLSARRRISSARRSELGLPPLTRILRRPGL